MKNPFAAVRKASRLLRKRRPFAAALALQRVLSVPAKPKRKRPALKPKPARIGHKTGSTPPRPAPGSFLTGRYDSGHGVIAYKLYTPAGSALRRMPLVVMLHGCTQKVGDFAAGTGMNALADEIGFIVLYPQQPRSANVTRCWNWHRPRNQRRGSGEPAMIAALTRHAMAACRVNPARVYIAGISAGGSMAAIMGQAYPDIYAAVGVHSGVPAGKVTTIAGALSAMRKGGAPAATKRGATPQPTIIFQGDRDRFVHPDNASALVGNPKGSKSRPLTSQTRKGRSDGGRDFTRTLYRSAAGEVVLENWMVHGGGHAWFGGKSAGTYTDPAGPDASRAMLRFFWAHKMTGDRRGG